jgi:dephospho-CoA kinase
MYKVGLTGNHFSGQDEVAKIFEDFDVPVFDANIITKFLINFSPKHISLIKNNFGNDIYKVGLLDLNQFTTNQHFNKLLDIIEFDILSQYEKFRIKHKNDFYTIFYCDNLFERSLDKYMNFVVNSYKPSHQRQYEMKYYTSYPFPLIENIFKNEMSPFTKNSKSDYVINNFNQNGDYKSDITVGLENKVKDIHKKIMSKKTSDIISEHYTERLTDSVWE